MDTVCRPHEWPRDRSLGRHFWLSGPGRRLPGSLLALGIMLLAAPAAGEGQLADVHGTVRATSGGGLASAQVVIAGTAHHAVSGRGGRFRIAGVPAGRYDLEVHFVGYRPTTVEVLLGSGEVVQVAVELELAPVELAAVEASSTRGLAPEIQGFYQRRSRAAGHFFTREQIHSMHARTFTDILRRVPGANVRSSSGPQGGSQSVSMGRTTGFSGSRSCDAVYFMNGMVFPVAADIGINAYIRPHDIEALEVYSGASRIPSEFNTGMRNARCGVVVIWTRSGHATGARAN